MSLQPKDKICLLSLDGGGPRSLDMVTLELMLRNITVEPQTPFESLKEIFPVEEFRPRFTGIKYPYNNSSAKVGPDYILPTNTFHAKEELQSNIFYSLFDTLQWRWIENETNLSPGEPETIWNSKASHLSAARTWASLIGIGGYSQLQSVNSCINDIDTVNRFLKGRYEEWGNLETPYFPTKIDKLFDRDHVWAVTQTMVSLETLALCAMHVLQAYKVYPDFWGRLAYEVYPKFWGRSFDYYPSAGDGPTVGHLLFHHFQVLEFHLNVV
ncbi:uncharacterized protein LY89DRAFT_61245 [Mollisia scopiformis]|uniref:Uncharacterized protein n=1 Tax=Mollisia scopiformis TaxID=149040 RepID=A0A194XC74_MOLSC|nr:uncharacterized protein LY89DRAFT_61245 [Mollisia scopiformis]KUJ17773.1 hypothetical protein LY89DRAFT_61245 [Mollisia scopiformis]